MENIGEKNSTRKRAKILNSFGKIREINETRFTRTTFWLFKSR